MRQGDVDVIVRARSLLMRERDMTAGDAIAILRHDATERGTSVLEAAHSLVDRLDLAG
jgi:AmiR/NasT family two-component response regulator